MTTIKSSWHGDAAKRAYERGAMTGLEVAADLVLSRSKAVVPWEESTLMRSGGTDRDRLKATVYFDTEYAVIQHEEVSYRHKPGRTAKYLENPLNASRRDVETIVGKHARAALGGN